MTELSSKIQSEVVYYLESSEKLGNLLLVALAFVILQKYKNTKTRKMEKEVKEEFEIKAKESAKESSVEPEYKKPKNNQTTLSNLIEQAKECLGQKSRRLEETEEEKMQYLKSNILLLLKLVNSPMWYIIIANNTEGNTKDDIIKKYGKNSDIRLLISYFAGKLAKNKLI